MTRLTRPPPRCFQGVVPAIIATCDLDGTPNVTYLSQVFAIDEQYVALSCQFFNKTKQNVLRNPFACVDLYDPITFDVYKLELRYERAELDGPLFDSMAMRIQAIASHTGMLGVFRLISADIYRVLSCEKREGVMLPPSELLAEPEEMAPARTEIRGLQLISQRTCRAGSLDELLDTTLATLDEAFGFQHTMVLLPDETGERLFAVASRGYEDEGIGAEVAMGEGFIGTVARERRPLRLSGIDTELRYGRAIRAGVQRTSARRELRPEIPLSGLSDVQSQMALPLVVGERLVGVLVAESKERLGFDEWDEAFLEIVSNQVGVALDNALLREGQVESSERMRSQPPAPRHPVEGDPRLFRFFSSDDCVFVGDDYLIRNVPGRILWKILCQYQETGRTEFSNRELRLDPKLGLPALRDNLESRLVLLRKRLEQKCPGLRLVPTTRGHFRLEVSCPLRLQEVDGAA